MRVIYEPKGKALEYAPLACNLYVGCPHGCRYCYGPTIPNPAKKGMTMEDWRQTWHVESIPKPNVLARLELDCATMQKKGMTGPVLLCFACDPYSSDAYIVRSETIGHGHEARYTHTHEALEIMRRHGIQPIILTKGGTLAEPDFLILRSAGGWFGQSMSFHWTDEDKRKEWEPNAAPIMDRLSAQRVATEVGLPTWWSVEPVIDTRSTLKLIYSGTGIVDHVKVGKISGYDAETRRIERETDWADFLHKTRIILAGNGYTEIDTPGAFEPGTFYIKRELKEAATPAVTSGRD